MHELSPADIAGRFREARLRGHPHWLWPDVDVAEWRRALSALEHTARALLAGVPASLPAFAPGAFTVAAYTSGLGPWLGWHAELGRVQADENTRAVLASHLDHGRRRASRLSAELVRTCAVLAGAGVDVTVLKGAHTGPAYFGDRALRPMADLDVLVAHSDVAAAEAALCAAGYVRADTTWHARPYEADWQPPGAPTTLRSLTLVHAEDPYAIDLHGSLDVDFFGVRTVPFDGVALTREAAPWLARGAHVLTQPLLAVHHAVHASRGLHGLTLLRLTEFALMLRRDMHTAADWDAFAQLLLALDAERFAYPALALTEKLSPGTVDSEVLARAGAAAPARLRRTIAALAPAAAQRPETFALAERFIWANGPIEHARRLLRMVLPTRTTGSYRRLLQIYIDRALRLARRRVSWQEHDPARAPAARTESDLRARRH